MYAEDTYTRNNKMRWNALRKKALTMLLLNNTKNYIKMLFIASIHLWNRFPDEIYRICRAFPASLRRRSKG